MLEAPARPETLVTAPPRRKPRGDDRAAYLFLAPWFIGTFLLTWCMPVGLSTTARAGYSEPSPQPGGTALRVTIYLPDCGQGADLRRIGRRSS